jgi:type IV pilus assembly protein PilV
MLTRQPGNSVGGATLLEALIAMLVLAIGVSALAWTQARLFGDGRESTGKAMAVLLAQDLGNRILFNRAAAASGHYALQWGEQPQAVDCDRQACSGATLARSDLALWRASVAQALPFGDAQVFSVGASTPRIGIAIAWGLGTPVDPLHQSLVQSDLARHGVNCPVERSCHVAYLPH